MVMYEQQEIINQHAIAAAGAGVPGSFIPASDLPILIGIWGTMISRLASESGHELDVKYAVKHLTAGTAGVGLYYAGGKLFGSLLHLFPFVGTLGYLAMNCTLNAIFTNRLGKLAANLFNSPDFDLDSLGDALESLSQVFKSAPTSEEIKYGYGMARRSGKF